MVNLKRVRRLKKGRETEGHVLYWMSRDQRVYDNWALNYAIEAAENEDQSVIVAFSLSVDFLGSTWRQYDFMLKGLKKVEEQLTRLNIPFYLVMGDPAETMPAFINQHRVSRLVVDFDPLRIKREWREKVMAQIEIPVDEVDAHNIVPCWLASDKAEYGASTIRGKISRLLPEFMDDFSPIVKQHGTFHKHRINWEVVAITVQTNHDIRPVDWITPGRMPPQFISAILWSKSWKNMPAAGTIPTNHVHPDFLPIFILATFPLSGWLWILPETCPGMKIQMLFSKN